MTTHYVAIVLAWICGLTSIVEAVRWFVDVARKQNKYTPTALLWFTAAAFWWSLR